MSSDKKQERSLRKQLLLGITLVSLLVTITLMNIFWSFVISMEQEKLDSYFTYIEDTLLDNLTYSVWTLNKTLVESQIEGLIALDYISHVEINHNNTHFASSHTVRPEHEDILTRQYELIHEGHPIGTLSITADLTGIYSNAFIDSFILFSFSLLLLIFLLVFTSVFLNRKILLPLEQLSRFMKEPQQQAGHKDFTLERKKSRDAADDELDQLIGAFNKQRNELNARNEQLRKSNALFYKVFQASHDAMIISEIETGRLIDVNKSFYEIFGFSENFDVIGKTATELNIWADEQPREVILQTLKDEGAIHFRESRFRRQPDEIRNSLVSVEIIDYADSRAIVVIVRDTTDTKRYQEKLLHSQMRLHNLARSQEEIREDERTGISREIHDELGQALTGLKFDLSWLLEHWQDKDKISRRIEQMRHNIDDSIDVVRRISSDLRPAVLDDLGLIAAIEWFTTDFSKRTQIAHTIDIRCDDLDTDKYRDTAIFRIYQEALTNIARHSQADSFFVTIQLINSKLEINIIDNGIGITDDNIHSVSAIGIIGMEERAFNINASLSISRHAEKGTQVILIAPLSTKRT